MGLTLQDALKIGKLRECKVVAGQKGWNRIIENVTIMEVPEVVPWLNNKELIITSLFAIKDDEDALNKLVPELNASGATALAIKPSHFIHKIPEVILEHGEKLGFPIIFIPEHVKYLDILSPVMRQVFDQKVVLQEDVEHATAILQEIFLNNQGTDIFIKNLEFLLQNRITVESELSFIDVPTYDEFTPLSTEKITELSIIQRPIQIKRTYNEETVQCIVAPIIVDGTYYGNITSWGFKESQLPIDLGILEKASTLLSLEFLKQKLRQDIEQQYETDFMRELLFSQQIKLRDVIEWGENYQITKDAPYVCLLFSAYKAKSNNKDYQVLKDYKIVSIIKELKEDVLAGYIRNGVCVIIPANANDLKAIYQTYFNEIQAYIGSDYQLSLGIGRVETGPEGIQKSFTQADQALYLGQSIRNMSGIVYFEQLGVYLLINQLKENQELHDFYDRTIGKLLEDSKNKELFTTLKTYFYYDEVLNITASKLFIHINTLKYRLKKVEEITGHDLKSTEGKLSLYLGLKIHELLNYD